VSREDGQGGGAGLKGSNPSSGKRLGFETLFAWASLVCVGFGWVIFVGLWFHLRSIIFFLLKEIQSIFRFWRL
jgi:hypothetical protein